MSHRAVTSAVVTLRVAAGVYTFGGQFVGREDSAAVTTDASGATGTARYPTNSEYVDVDESELPVTTEAGADTTDLAPTKPVKPAGPNGTPTTQTPSTQTPSTQTPVTQTPSTQTPSTQTPATQTPTSTGTKAFPTTIPVTIDGATVTRYLPSNDIQAGMLGLEPGSVRSWTLTFTTTADQAADHQRMRSGLSAAGMRVVSDDLQYFLDSGSGQIVGNWQGHGFILNVVNWTNLTFSLVNW
jgi:hypothetical protein